MASPALLREIRTIDDPRRTVISGATYNHLARAVRNMTIDGGNIGLNPLGGIHIQVTPQAASSPVPGGSAYDGPFAVTVSGGVATVASGTIFAGTTKIAYNGGTIAVADGNCVYVSVTYGNGTYNAFIDALPYGMIGQYSGQYTQILGKYSNGIWSQWWNAGDIQVCGRVV
jgi:hypothetical protein